MKREMHFPFSIYFLSFGWTRFCGMILRERSREIFDGGNEVVGKEDKERETEREGRKDARSHLECMQLALFRAMFMRGEATTGLSLLEITSPDASGKRKRGSALAYCLKLLIGLRSDTAFPRYAVFLPLSFSLCVFLSNPPSTHHPSRLPCLPPPRLPGFDFLDAYCRRRQTVVPDRGNQEGARLWLLRNVGISAVHSATFFSGG